MQIDRTITNNKPDVIIRDNGKGACVLEDVVICVLVDVICVLVDVICVLVDVICVLVD